MLNFGCVQPSAPQGGSLNFCVVCTLVVSPRMLAKSAWQSRCVEKKGVIWWWKPILSYQAHDIHDASYQKGRKDRIVPVETFICSEIGLIWWWRIITAYRLYIYRYIYPGFILAGQFLLGIIKPGQRMPPTTNQQLEATVASQNFSCVVHAYHQLEQIVPSPQVYATRLGESETDLYIFCLRRHHSTPCQRANAYHVYKMKCCIKKNHAYYLNDFTCIWKWHLQYINNTLWHFTSNNKYIKYSHP